MKRFFGLISLLRKSLWMSGNPTLRHFFRWNEVHSGTLCRNFRGEKDQCGEANRRIRFVRQTLISLICIVLLLGGCGTTGKLTGNLMIIDPTTPEDELDERVQELKDRKAQSTSKKEKSVTPKKEEPAAKKEESVTSEKVQPKETTASEEPLMSTDDTQEALINLLEKKGIINRRELLEEIKKLQQKSK